MNTHLQWTGSEINSMQMKMDQYAMISELYEELDYSHQYYASEGLLNAMCELEERIQKDQRDFNDNIFKRKQNDRQKTKKN